MAIVGTHQTFVMELLTRSKLAGFTLVELILIMGILVLLISGAVVVVNPSEYLKKSRDNKRLSNLETLDRAINEFLLDNGRYPGTENILFSSTSPSGWIDEDLSQYTSVQPIDPSHDKGYYLMYFHNSNSYEVNAQVEYLFDEAANDGGDDPNMYELGNNLNLITP